MDIKTKYQDLQKEFYNQMRDAQQYIIEKSDRNEKLTSEEDFFDFEYNEWGHYGNEEPYYLTNTVDAYKNLVDKTPDIPWNPKAKETLQTILNLGENIEQSMQNLKEFVRQERTQERLDKLPKKVAALAKVFVEKCRDLDEALWKDDNKRDQAIKDLIKVAEDYHELDYSQRDDFDTFVRLTDSNLLGQLENIKAWAQKEEIIESAELINIVNTLNETQPQYFAKITQDQDSDEYYICVMPKDSEKSERPWAMEMCIRDDKLRGRVTVYGDGWATDIDKLKAEQASIYVQADKLMELAKEIRHQDKEVEKEGLENNNQNIDEDDEIKIPAGYTWKFSILREYVEEMERFKKGVTANKSPEDLANISKNCERLKKDALCALQEEYADENIPTEDIADEQSDNIMRFYIDDAFAYYNNKGLAIPETLEDSISSLCEAIQIERLSSEHEHQDIY